MHLPKWSRFHFKNETVATTTVVESNEILLKGSKVKFNGVFYNVNDVYSEILPDGNLIYHHILNQ